MTLDTTNMLTNSNESSQYLKQIRKKTGTLFISLFLIPYKWLFSRVLNFRFIRDSHRSEKKRTCVNFCPLQHKYLYFLK